MDNQDFKNPEIPNVDDGDLLEMGVPFDAAQTKKEFSFIGAGIALYFVISIVAFSLFYLLASSFGGEWWQSTVATTVFSNVAYYICAFPVLYLIFTHVKQSQWKKTGISFGGWLIFLAVALGLMYIGGYLGNGVMGIFSALFGKNYANGLNSLAEGGSIWVVALVTVVIAPLGEEFIYRKLIIDRTAKYGCLLSVILSSTVFALAHGNFYQLFYAFMVGLVLGYLYYRTGNFLLNFALHAFLNLWGGVIPMLLQDKLLEMVDQAEKLAESSGDNGLAFLAEYGGIFSVAMAVVVIQFASIAAAIVLPIVLRKRITYPSAEISIPRGKVATTVILNIGMLAMLAVYAFNLIMSLI